MSSLMIAPTLNCHGPLMLGRGRGHFLRKTLGRIGAALLRPLVNRINCIPLDEEAGEATCEVRLSSSVGTRRARR